LRYLFEEYALDIGRRELRRATAVVPLTPQEFDLLAYLIHNRDRVVSKDDLIAAIWNDRSVSDSALTTRINAARSAIGDTGKAQRLIRTLPRRGIRFVGAVREEQQPGSLPAADTATKMLSPALTLPDGPSVAVLPFTISNLNGSWSYDYFSDGITEDIITELSRFSELFVIARNSSFRYRGTQVDLQQVSRDLGVRYVLRGSIRRSEDRVRISAQLIDALTATHRWADRYDRMLDDIFAVQEEVARTIVTTLSAHVRKAEAEHTMSKAPASWRAYDYYMRGADVLASYWSSVKVQELYEARRLLEHAITIDPAYARAYATLSTTFMIAWINPLDGDHLNPTALDRAHQLAGKAVQRDPNLPQAYASLCPVLATKRQHDAAIVAFEKATTLNPNYSDWRFAFALVLAGQPARAIQVLQALMRLDPFYGPLAPHWLGRAYYMLKQYPQALASLRECLVRAPNYRSVHLWLAATHVQLGQLEEAATEAAEVLRLDPRFTINGSARLMLTYRYEHDAEAVFDALRRAGLPEG
jgi:adenylate cyclase